MATEAGSNVVTCGGMRRLWVPLVAVLLVWAPGAVGEEIPWRSGASALAVLDRAELAAAVAEITSRSDAQHVVVQFDQPVAPAGRRQLQAAGLKLLNPLGGGAYFASLSGPGVDAAALSAMPSLTGIQAIERPWKLDPLILAGEVPDWAVVKDDATGSRIVGVYVLFHP